LKIVGICPLVVLSHEKVNVAVGSEFDLDAFHMRGERGADDEAYGDLHDPYPEPFLLTMAIFAIIPDNRRP
jgi:hypothetical protein